MNKKNISIVLMLCIGMLIFQGCQTEKPKSTESISIQGAKQLAGKNTYASVTLNNNLVLMAGENGMYMEDIIDNGTGKNKNLKQFKITQNFKIPTFVSYDEIDGRKMQKRVTNGENNESVDKPKIYTMLKLDDGLLVGGKFAQVNGQYQDNLVKLNADGSISKDFNGSVEGAVYKLTQLGQDIIVSGIFGAYNESEAYSIVKINSNGERAKDFMPFKDYTLVKINDVEVYGSDKLILGGTFIKEIGTQDENATKEEILSMTKSILILDKNGNILEEESNKFDQIRNEVYAIAKDSERLYIAGDFEFTKNGKNYNALVAYTRDGEFDSTFQIDKLHGMIFDVGLSEEMIIFGGDFIADEDNSTNRSFYIVDKSGNTLKVENFTSDADIYNIDIYNGNIVVSGEGEFKVNNQSYTNGLILKIN
jgi:hypothetical protein